MRSRNTGSNRRSKRLVLLALLIPILAWADQIWTDFSPKPEANVIVIDDPQTDEIIVMIKDPVPAEVKPESTIDKERYRKKGCYIWDFSIYTPVAPLKLPSQEGKGNPC